MIAGLIVILDDATSEIYYTQLVEAEGTQLRVDCRRAVPPRKEPLEGSAGAEEN